MCSLHSNVRLKDLVHKFGYAVMEIYLWSPEMVIHWSILPQRSTEKK